MLNRGTLKSFLVYAVAFPMLFALGTQSCKTTKKQPVAVKQERSRQNDRRRMTFKERREFEQLGLEIEALEAEKKQLEADLCSGTLSVDELTAKSKRLPQLTDELDEKSMRWLELSEIE